MKQVDLILKSKAVFTGLKDEPEAAAVLVTGNRILDVVSIEESEKWSSPTTTIYDLDDKLVLPGFIDAHTHYFSGAIADSPFVCSEIADASSEDMCVEMIKKFAEKHPDYKRIRGYGWFMNNWEHPVLPDKRKLDEAVPDRPVYLVCTDSHSMWLNSKALEEAGITKDTVPPSGSIGKFPDGELNGMLIEPEAYAPAMEKYLDFTDDEMIEIHRSFLKKAAAFGVTSLSEMFAEDYTPAVFHKYDCIKELEKQDAFTLRLHIFTKLFGYTDFTKALETKQKYDSEKVQISGVKGFIDGVAETYTGLMLEPYSDRPDTCGEGVPLVPKDEIEQSVLAANAAGLPVRLHCIADGSVHMALDIFEHSKKVNAGKECLNRNTIEHLETITPKDIDRFAELSVIPSMQPYHLVLDQNTKIVRVGEERCKYEWPCKSVLDAGGALALGTDYPVVSINPYPTLHAAVTRKDDANIPTGTNPWETITLSDALKAYTLGAAKVYHREKDLGTLEAGKLADITVVDRNLFAISPDELGDAATQMTIFDGKIIYANT